MFVTSHRYGKRTWMLHFHGEVPIAERQSELTRAQIITLEKLDQYWSEKAKKESRRDMSRHARRP